MRAFELTKNNDYLDVAKNIWLDMVYNGVTTPCGGTSWSIEKDAVNSIAKELLFALSAHLAVSFPDDPITPWAKYTWQWFEVSGMINGDNLIVEGLNLDMCKKGYLPSNNGAILTYTQGVILGALVQLSNIIKDPSLIARARTLADAGLQHFGPNIFGESQCDPSCTGDAVQFKGVFMRNLAVLQGASPETRYAAFIKNTADSVWANDRIGQAQFGTI